MRIGVYLKLQGLLDGIIAWLEKLRGKTRELDRMISLAQGTLTLVMP